MYSPVLLVMIVDDSLNDHAYWNTNFSCTIIDYHGPSCSLDKFEFDMILDDSFCRLNERMIVGDNFSVSSLANNGFKPKWQMVK